MDAKIFHPPSPLLAPMSFWPIFLERQDIPLIFTNNLKSKVEQYWAGFFLGCLHMGGDLFPPHMDVTSAGEQSVNGGTHEGGPNFARLYHKLKVLLLLSCNYMMQFIGYNSIKTQ